ncbi:DUF1476 domain-containing protein [Salipiger sp. H15]|uniref:DUF1476 domain-containing protein n=1 Tax=Alloyangia sp. H15 TaxID=3029062 RepID=A0AAU8AGJ3_9RHOB
MTTFDDREKAFENKFAHDEEMRFRAEARCNKLLGLWAAAQLGKAGAEAEAYALDVCKVDFHQPGHEDVIAKVTQDLGERAGTDAVRTKRAALLLEAQQQILAES